VPPPALPVRQKDKANVVVLSGIGLIFAVAVVFFNVNRSSTPDATYRPAAPREKDVRIFVRRGLEGMTSRTTATVSHGSPARSRSLVATATHDLLSVSI
jgi:hypothetical protein